MSRLVTMSFVILAMLVVASCQEEVPTSATVVTRAPKLKPDYAGVVIPPNIVPLNFVIDEPGEKYLARFSSASQTTVEVANDTGRIVIPPKAWRQLVTANAGRELKVDVYVKTSAGNWTQYQTVRNTIAAEAIDPYLVYRYMAPSSYFPKRMRICQRHLESFDENVLLDTRDFGDGCAHCHTFVGHDADRMLLGIRSTSFPSATMYVHDGRIDKIGAKFGYTAWHPSGRIAIYSVNKVKQFFHTAQQEIHDVVDLDSAIFYYDVAESKIKKTPALADRKRLETYPTWTPDGTYLYFCSAPLLWTDMETVPPQHYEEVKYDLMRVRYDVQTDQWGPLETVLRAADTGRSILLPRISPDGRFLLFCMSQYGCFPIFQPTSDLYLMDLQTGTYRKTSVNSDDAEGWHSWSSNSRWVIFSSKRQGGLFTRPFVCYVDADGVTHKPFVLPQKDPTFYESCYHVYSVPELIAAPVTVEKKALVRAITGTTPIQVDSMTGATPKAASRDAYTRGQSSVQ